MRDRPVHRVAVLGRDVVREHEVARRARRIGIDAEFAKRREAWTAPAPRYTRGVQAKFAFNAASASKGAVLDDY